MAASMAAGMVIGMGAGMAIGIGSGIGIGRSAALSEVRKKIRNFFRSREIRLQTVEGGEVSHDEFLDEVTPGAKE